MRVLVAPDKFAGSLTAPEAAAAIAAGWRSGDPVAEVDEAPVADGGDGTLDVLLAGLGGRRESVRVTGPLGEPVEAELGLVGSLAVVEMARASGLRLVPQDRRDPLRSTTRGTGELILAAARLGAREVIVCVGGSATNDGGAGMAQALGVRMLDADGHDLAPGGEALRSLDRIDPSGLADEVRRLDVVVAADVDSPLVGATGASAVFGPQKGATPEAVRVLEEGLRNYARVIERDLDIHLAEMPGAGAAGGLAAGLIAFLGARMRSGFEVVADALRLDERLERADVAVTGEGRFDRQTERGKAPAGVLEMARRHGCRTVLIAGQVAPDVAPDVDLSFSLAARAGGVEAAIAGAVRLAEDAAREAALALGAAR